MAFLASSSEKARFVIKYVSGFFLLVTGFLAIVFTSPSRTFNVGIGDYDADDTGVAHADAPDCGCESDPGFYSCDGASPPGAGGDGCGEGK